MNKSILIHIPLFTFFARSTRLTDYEIKCKLTNRPVSRTRHPALTKARKTVVPTQQKTTDFTQWFFDLICFR
jgi:hypothetical protein